VASRIASPTPLTSADVAAKASGVAITYDDMRVPLDLRAKENG
jgi:hypothetical protein